MQHLRPGVHPRVQQKIVSGDEEKNPGDTRFDNILNDPLWFQILRAKDVKDRSHEALQDQGEIEDHQGDLREIFNHHHPSDCIRSEKSIADILISLIV